MLQGTVLHEGKVKRCWAVQYAGVVMVVVSSFLDIILVACWSVQAPPRVISAEAYVATLTPTL